MKKINILLGVFIVLLCLIKSDVILVIDENEILLIDSVTEGDVFIISNIHSVSKSSIIETFKIDHDLNMILEESRYYDQGGAGMPDVLEKNESVEITSEGFIVKRNRVIGKKIRALVDEESQWTVKINNQVVEKLKTTYITIETKKMMVLTKLMYEVRMLLNEI